MPTGWGSDAGVGADVAVQDARRVLTSMGSRAYFADACAAGRYDHKQYLAPKLLGKTLRYSVDLSKAGCGCNAAVYLTSMKQNTRPGTCSDYYCDANSVCGEACTEIDLQEANRYSWHSTLHGSADTDGVAAGYGGGGRHWSGPRQWDAFHYAPGGRCIDTLEPFNVSVSFPVDSTGSLAGMQVTLSQDGHPCPLALSLDEYQGMAEVARALDSGMTPVVSYWSSDDMLWLDGKGSDDLGPCEKDAAEQCGDTVAFFDFSVSDIEEGDQAPMLEKATVGPKGERCPGSVRMAGYGKVELVPTGWLTPHGGADLVVAGGRVSPQMGARGYFADTCTPGAYDHRQYVAPKLLGHRIRYTANLSGAGCGCNAAFYLTSMRQNARPTECFDHYCDASQVCGEACAEIDIQEANQYAWHSTLHTATDTDGVSGGYGGGGDSWSGPRDWTAHDYGPGGKCIDTGKPFQVEAAFPVDADGSLLGMQVTLSQKGQPCSLSRVLGEYDGLAELSKALDTGMTPVLSYWSDDDMLWMDGKGSDGKGACEKDSASSCADYVHFYDFALEDLDDASGSAQVRGLQGSGGGEDLLVQAKAVDVPSRLTEGDDVLVSDGDEKARAEVLSITRSTATGVIEEHKWQAPILRGHPGQLPRPVAMVVAALLTLAIAVAAAAWPRAWRRLGGDAPAEPARPRVLYERLGPEPAPAAGEPAPSEP